MNRLLIAFTLVGCTATVRTAGPPPAEPAPPPPAPAYTPAPAPAPAPAPVVTAPPPPAAEPGHHAAYLAAIKDLRQARALLQRTPGMPGDVKWDEKAAIREIDATIKAVHEAKLDVGAAPEEPVVDIRRAYGDRLAEAQIKLSDAVLNLSGKEDSMAARHELHDAADHLNAAEHLLAAALKERHSDAGPPPPAPPPVAAAHPAYMAALGNLRQARALLERPAGAADVKWDEHTALKDIDEAFEEIRKARVDDGKPMTEHPPIENGLVYRDRLKEAEKQLHEAGADLDSREDNFWAKKDRRRAVDAIRRAERATHEAMADRKEDKAEKKEEKREEKADKKAAKGH